MFFPLERKPRLCWQSRMLGKATHSADAQCPTYLDASMGLTPTPLSGGQTPGSPACTGAWGGVRPQLSAPPSCCLQTPADLGVAQIACLLLTGLGAWAADTSALSLHLTTYTMGMMGHPNSEEAGESVGWYTTGSLGGGGSSAKGGGGPVTSHPRAQMNHTLVMGRVVWNLLDCLIY